jgi:hypothetical protein
MEPEAQGPTSYAFTGARATLKEISGFCTIQYSIHQRMGVGAEAATFNIPEARSGVA